MHKFLLLFVFLFTTSVFSQSPVPSKIPTKRELMIRKINYTLEKSIVFEFLRKCIIAINKGNKSGKVVPARKYSSYNEKMKTYLKYPWFIADTGLSKRWLSDVQKLTEYMYKTRDLIDTEIINGHTETVQYKQALKYFDVAYKRFVKLVKKPVKVSSKVQRRVKLKKALWQKAMRKKYKIKDKPSMEEF